MIANKIRIRFIKDDRVLQRMIRQLRGKPARIVHDGVPYGVIQEFGSATKAEGPVPKTPAYEILPKKSKHFIGRSLDIQYPRLARLLRGHTQA